VESSLTIICTDIRYYQAVFGIQDNSIEIDLKAKQMPKRLWTFCVKLILKFLVDMSTKQI
jgi:hypothetical protein